MSGGSGQGQGPEPAGEAAGEAAGALRRTPVWLRALLVLSLAANLAVAGLVLGAVWGRGDRPGPARDPASALFLGAMPEHHREMLGQRLRAEAQSRRGAWREARADFGAALEAIRAETFEPEALAGAVGRQRGRLAERIALGDRLLIEAISAMTLEERRAYADRLEAELRGMFRRRH